MIQKIYLLVTIAYLGDTKIKERYHPAFVNTDADAMRCITALAEDDLQLYDRVACKITHNDEVIGEFTLEKTI